MIVRPAPSILVFAFGLSACSTTIQSSAPPIENIIEKSAPAAETQRWGYRLFPIILDAGSTDDEIYIWHEKISRDSFSTEALCKEAASKGLESLGGEAWNYKVICVSPLQNSAPIAVIDASELDLGVD